MYIQEFVKGIVGDAAGGPSWADAVGMVAHGHGILSNWWRNKNLISPPEVQDVLTMRNLWRHLHDYDSFGGTSPFISLASGCIERNTLLQKNFCYSSIDTALGFATRDFMEEGYLFYGWVFVGLNPAVEISSVAESVRDLNVYHEYSIYQLEGEITAKVHVPANQIERVERWDPRVNRECPVETFKNTRFLSPSSVLNFRELF